MDKLLLGLAFDIFSALCTALNSLFIVFLNLANTTTKIIDTSDIINNIYVLISIVMIFYLTITLLTYLVSPSRLTDKNSGGPKILIKFAITLALLVFTPRLFSLSRDLQTAVLSENILGKIILSADMEMDDSNFRATSQLISRVLAKAYITNKEHYTSADLDDNDFLNGNTTNMSTLKVFAENNTNYEFNWIMAIGTAAILCLMLINFLFDIAVRVIKLMFLEIVAPIPILCYPLSQKKGIFDKWLKETGSAYGSLFIKLALIYFVVYIIMQLSLGELLNENPIIFSLIIVGALLFVKQLPQLLQDVFGIKGDGNFSLNPMDRIRQVPILGTAAHTAAGAIGGLATGIGFGYRAAGGASGIVNAFKTGGFSGGMSNIGRNIGMTGLRSTAVGMRAGFNQVGLGGVDKSKRPKEMGYTAGASSVAQAITGDSNAKAGIVNRVFNDIGTHLNQPTHDQNKAIQSAEKNYTLAEQTLGNLEDSQKEIKSNRDVSIARRNELGVQLHMVEENLIDLQADYASEQTTLRNSISGQIAQANIDRNNELSSSLGTIQSQIADAENSLNAARQYGRDTDIIECERTLQNLKEQEVTIRTNVENKYSQKIQNIQEEGKRISTTIDNKYEQRINSLTTQRDTLNTSYNEAVAVEKSYTDQYNEVTAKIEGGTYVDSTGATVDAGVGARQAVVDAKASVDAEKDKLRNMHGPYQSNK